MSKLRSQLNNLTADPVAAQNPLPHQVSANMRAIEETQRKLSPRQSPRQMAGEPAATFDNRNNDASINTEALADSLANSVGENLRQHMSSEIDRMRHELETLQQNANETADRALLDDIQRISAGIHELQAHQAASSNQYGEMAGELRGIHQDIASITQNHQPELNSQEVSQTIQLSYQEIAKKLDSLGSSQMADHIVTLSDKLEAFKENIPSTDPQTLQNIEGQMQALGEGITWLVRNGQPDTAQSASIDPSATFDAIVPEYFESLERRLDEITRAVVASAPMQNGEYDGEAFERIEARIASLAKSVDNLSLDTLQSAENSQFSDLMQMPEQLQSTLARLEERISQLSISAFDDEKRAKEDFAGPIDALAQKIDQLQSISANLNGLRPVDANVDANVDGPVDGDVGAKLESLTLLLERAINSGDSSIGQLDRQISELSARIDEAVTADQQGQDNRDQNETRMVEELQAIVARVDSIDPAQQNGEAFNSQLSALENQMASIGAQLQSIGQPPDLSAIENRLGGIEEQFAASREVTIEAANQALQQSASNGNDENQASMIASLADELKNLSRASSELKGHSFETFDAVRESLAMILDRINSIELRMVDGDITPVAAEPSPAPQNDIISTDMAAAARNYAAEVAERSKMQHHREPSELVNSGNLNDQVGQVNIRDRGDIGLPAVEAPSLDLRDIPEMGQMPAESQVDFRVQSEDLPLEPGSGAPEIHKNGPDMDALMRRAKKNKRKQTLEDEQQNPTDFIAAARRAAQAAANEANISSDKDTISTETDGKNDFKQRLTRKKKLLMLGATIILLAALAIPVKNFLPNMLPLSGSKQVTQISQQEQVLTPETATLADGKQEIIQQTDENVAVELSQDITGQQASKLPGRANLSSDGNIATHQDTEVTPIGVPKSVQLKPADNAGALSGDASTIVQAAEPVMPPSEIGPVALRLAAFNGDPKAMFEVGRRYTNGLNGVPDFASATKWYQLAAKANHAPAQYRLGNFNEKGHGGARDVNKAARWYRLSAEQGNALAMHNLAVINAMGVLEKGADMKEASIWFAKAAELGIKDSQVNLGIVYAKAMGVEADLVKAYKWFAIAARAGDKDGAQKRDTIAKQLRTEQLQQARGEVELWRAQELNQDANSLEIPEEWRSDTNVTASLNSSAMIQKSQTILTKLGFNPGAADGLMGENTIEAIRKFQRQAGILVDGKVSSELINALEKANP